MISLIILLIILGFVVWLLRFLPIGEPFMTIITAVFVLVAVVAVLDTFGITHFGVRLR